MNISTNLINNFIKPGIQTSKSQAPIRNNNTKTSAEILPSNPVYRAMPNIPVAYTKIAEIEVPGVKDKAHIYKLSNGQKVAILHKDGPTYIRTSFGVGALNETDDKRGISHFIEHNLFNGSNGLISGEYDKLIQNAGGSTNAYTSLSQTQYHLNLQLLYDNSLDEAIKLNALLTQYPTFPDDALQREKEPVKSEIDMCADDITNKAYSVVLKNMFDIKSDADTICIGTKANVNSFTRDDLIDYYKTWYTPDNAVTVITGDVDPDETIKKVAQRFNKTPDLSKIHKRIYEPLNPTNKATRVDIKQNNSNDAQIVAGFPVDAGTSPSDLRKLNILFTYISSKNSSMTKSLDKYGITLNFATDTLSSDINASKAIYTTISTKENNVEDIIKIMYKELASLAQTPPSEKDIQNLKDTLLYATETETTAEDVSEELVNILKTNDFNYKNETENDIRTVTPEELSALAAKFLNTNRISLCVAHAQNTTDEDIKAAHKRVNTREKVISFGKSEDAVKKLQNKLSQTEFYTTSNNMNIAFIPSDSDTETHLISEFRSVPNFNISAAQMNVLNIMLSRGNSASDNINFSNKLAELKTDFNFNFYQDGPVISASFPSANVNEVLPLIKYTLLNPNFTEKEFERAKNIAKEACETLKKSPEDKLNAKYYPDNAKYGDKEAQLKSLENFTLEDVKRIYYDILYNSQAYSVLTGSFQNADTVKNSAFLNFGNSMPMFKPFERDFNSDISVYKPTKEEITLTDTEENAQASIISSYSYKHTGNIDDSAKIMLLNRILGGGMSSRLFNDLRNEEKIAYHVKSYTDKVYDNGTINLEIETSADSSLTREAASENVTKALNGFKRNVEKLKSETVSEEELESAKAICKSIILNGNETVLDTAFTVGNSFSAHEGLYHDIELLTAIDSVTPEDIKAAANYVFKNPPVTSVIASKRTLEELNLS